MHDDHLLEIERLHTFFRLAPGTIQAVAGVSLTINRGEVVALVGESGCGKSALARSILRLVRPPGQILAGAIRYQRVAGEVLDLVALDPDGAELQRVRGGEIGFVLQEPLAALSPVHTIGAQLIETYRLHHAAPRSTARAAALMLLRRLGLPEAERRINAYPHELSGGMRQRALIALALIGEPRLLIADEPTTALDAIGAAQVLLALRAVQQERAMAMLFITHNLRLALHYADSVAVMYLGLLVECAPARRLLSAPAHPYTQALLRSALHLSGGPRPPLVTLQGSLPDPFQRPPGCPFHPRCPMAMPGLCDQQEPPLVTSSPGQQVRCHLYADQQ